MAKKQIDKQELERRVNGYLKRMKKRGVPKISKRQRGLYRIVSGGYGDYGKTHTIAIARGTFKQVLEYAVQQSEFLGDWCSWTFPDNCNHGHVEKVNVVELGGKRK